MIPRTYPAKLIVSLGVWLGVAICAAALDSLFPGLVRFSSGVTLLKLVGVVAGIMAVTFILKLGSYAVLRYKRRPAVEAPMVGQLYNLLAALALVMAFAYSFGKLGAAGAMFAAFGGMLLGWSLQAPVSGFAAWVLVSLKRPFRPGDRVQFPSLGLTGDVKDIGAMYTVLNQVGGSIASEEAVGRYILVPNAMLFSQVVINYTVLQESPYMLDEVTIRITYDSDWEEAERILISAATEVTRDIIAATGVKPYIRSDMYDYGVYLRLRYQIRVKDRVEIVSRITKQIFTDFQKAPGVDWAIPYIYSNKAALEKREEEPRARGAVIQKIELGLIRSQPGGNINEADVEQLAQSISSHGLLQPIVVVRNPQDGRYDVMAGHLRFEACKRLGWSFVPAIVHGAAVGSSNGDDPASRAAAEGRK